MKILLPNVLAVNAEVETGRIRQLAERGVVVDGDLAKFTRGKLQGLLFRPREAGPEVVVATHEKFATPTDARVVLMKSPSVAGNLRDGVWVRHPSRRHDVDFAAEIRAVQDSWMDAFRYVQEDVERGVLGLRRPQIGAIHAIQGYWTVSSEPGTIVMPTGTGKTDTMIAALISVPCTKVLVVVPTDALRTQIADSFLTLGALRREGCKVIADSAHYPIVATLDRIPQSRDAVDELFGRAQVIVATSAVVGQSSREVQARMAAQCSHLFLDEAHHSEAPTWKAFRNAFAKRRVLQFTATPFREDGKPLEGTIIYRYPLRKAQEEEYFKPIRFSSVLEFNPARSDAAIAQRAIEQLRIDYQKGHIVMARVATIERAKAVYKLYEQFTEFHPVELHTGISGRRREEARRKILSGESRIIVCVDMLGEGFDLPELKIAAFHDIKKSLAVTLQLAGRFTRSRPNLGDATFIANVADVNVRAELQKLYRRDPDWNILLTELSERVIGEQVDLKEFFAHFDVMPEHIPLHTVTPATSMVAYKTTCDEWRPENFRKGIPGIGACEQVKDALNDRANTLVIVTAKRVALPWIDVANLYTWEWELYVLVWSKEQNLLFINGSTNAGEYKALAQAVCGDDIALIRGQEVFRAFAGINRLRLQNVGLTEILGKNVRFTNRMGADVGPALPDVQRQRAVKAVLSGGGFEEGERATIGASRKGRIWSHARGNIKELVEWCKRVGDKLLDATIDPDEVLKGTLEAVTITSRPSLTPTAIDWPEEMYRTPENDWEIIFEDARPETLAAISLELVNTDADGPLSFAAVSENWRAEFELELTGTEENPNYKFVSPDKISIRRRGSSEIVPMSDYFYEEPPAFWFHDGSKLEGNQFVPLKKLHPPFDPGKIEVWDWSGTDITKESQGVAKEPDSIQAHVIRELKRGDYMVVFDDDGKGEAADVVAIKANGSSEAPSSIDIEFYHCKFSQQPTKGHRLKDLYELCGQAQKSIGWKWSHEKLASIFQHLLQREAIRRERGLSSRIEVGTENDLLLLREVAQIRPINIRITIVQPGLARSEVTHDQLELLSVTENHLWETYQLPLRVIGSA